jgi:hypothetical protein
MLRDAGIQSNLRTVVESVWFGDATAGNYDLAVGAIVSPAAGALGVRLGPTYGEAAGGPASEELRAIYVEPILERIGQRLQIALRNSLNPIGQPTPERYRLRTTLATYLTNLGIESQPYRPRSPRRNRRWSRRWWMQTRSLPSQTNSELEERCRIGDSFTAGFREPAPSVAGTFA